jgi:hypothetical protein
MENDSPAAHVALAQDFVGSEDQAKRQECDCDLADRTD